MGNVFESENLSERGRLCCVYITSRSLAVQVTQASLIDIDLHCLLGDQEVSHSHRREDPKPYIIRDV
jgi:hypothetical protein